MKTILTIITLLTAAAPLLTTAATITPLPASVRASTQCLSPALTISETPANAPKNIDGLTLSMAYTLTNDRMAMPYSSEVTFKATEIENQYEMTGFLADGVFDETVKVLPLKVDYLPEEGRLLIPCNQIPVIYMGNEFTLYNIHEGDEQLTDVPLLFEYSDTGGFNWISTIPVKDAESGELVNYTSIGGFLACLEKFQWIYRIESPFFVKTNGTFTGSIDVSGDMRNMSQTVSVEYDNQTLSVRNWISTSFDTTINLTVDSEAQTVTATDAYVADNVRIAASTSVGGMAEPDKYVLTGHYNVVEGRTRVEFPIWSAYNDEGLAAYYMVRNSVLEFDIPLPSSSGVTDVAADEMSEAEYYTLDGRKVTLPASYGIYIVRQGNHVKKIAVK